MTINFSSIGQTLGRHKKKSIAIGIVLLLVLLAGWRMSRPKQPEYVTEVAARGDLRQTVEAVGTVTSDRDLELKFAGVGVVQFVYVKEGDHVRAGQRLAQLKAGNLGASVAAQQAQLQSALADLAAMEQGTRPEDIAVAEADLGAKKAALQVAQSTLESAGNNLKTAQDQLVTLRQEASVNLSGQVNTAVTTVEQQLVTTENALSTVDDILNDVDVQDAILKDRPGADNDVRTQKTAALNTIAAARSTALKATDYEKALQALTAARSATDSAASVMNSLFSLIGSIRESTHFSNADREGFKNTISTQRSTIQSASSTLTGQQSALQNASAGYDSKIASQESSISSLQGTRDRASTDILTYQAAIRTSQAQLDLKKAGSRPTDIQAARAGVRAAQANLARAGADYSDTVLTAPIAGIVSHVNIRIGEGLPAGPAVTMIGDSAYRIEMFVSEIDVPKLQVTQSGSIELDAFRDMNMKLAVSQIDSAPTLKDGVSKYRVMLDFVHDHPEVKIGMTGDAMVITGSKQGVVSVAGRAVLESTGSGMYVRVLSDDQSVEERPVITGMEGESGEIEITSGLKGGETVIVLEKK